MLNYTPKEPRRPQNSYATAGKYGKPSHKMIEEPKESKKGEKKKEEKEPMLESDMEQKIPQLVRDVTKNFMDDPIIVMDGLEFNHYETLKCIHFYLQSRFLSGELDENKNEKYFHNIIVPRNAHATKNIDLDSKDLLISSDTEEGWWFSFLLRNELQKWMRKPNVQFGKLLNDLAVNLPNFGKVIWKKCGSGEDVYLKELDLRDAIFAPDSQSIRASGIFIERSIIAPWEAMQKAEAGYWHKGKTRKAILGAQAKKDKFLKEGSPAVSAESQYSLTDTIPSLDAWEVHGWFPKTCVDGVEEVRMLKDVDQYADPSTTSEAASPEESEKDETEYVYGRAIVLGLEDSMGHVVEWMELEPEDFPYFEFNYFRRIPGRCLPVSNTEALFSLQARMNELVNRFFAALRIGSLHLYQTRTATSYKNLLQDAQDGDVVETKSEIAPIATELRAFQQYQVEVQNIEAQADRICNTVEVVTGESMPTNTPFRLSAQLGMSAAKIYDQIREDIGLGLTFMFENWILPELMDSLTQEHILEVSGSVDELKMFDQQNRKYLLTKSLKDFILSQEKLPTEMEMRVAEEQLAESLEGKTRKVTITNGYFTLEKMRNLRIYLDVTDERKNFGAEKETMTNLLQIIASNPAVLQNPDSRALVGRLMEASGLSPFTIASFASKPVDPNAGMADAASPAAESFSQNPGDAASAQMNTSPAGVAQGA